MSFSINLNKYKRLATSPKEFFRSIAKEDVIPSIKFYLYFVAIFSGIILIINAIMAKLSLTGGIISSIVGLITSIMLSFLMILIFSALVYVGILIYNKGKAEFNSIFKTILYSLTITLLYSTLSVIIASGFEVYHPLNPLLSQFNQQTDPSIIVQEIINDKIHLSRIVLIFLISLLSIIHLLSLATLGLTESHKLKKWRAFLSIVTIPIIIMLLIIIALILAVSSV